MKKSSILPFIVIIYVCLLLFNVFLYPALSQTPSQKELEGQMKQAKTEAQQQVAELEKEIADAKINGLVYWLQGPGQDASYYMSNLRLAVGVPDTRKKILEQNKWVTHGILFDVNSDKIKPESYGTLKEMATVLKENPDLKVKIVGHTDADGSDAANLDLSKKRAAAVKESLAKEFGIDESRMETDGKGESEPIDTDTTSAGKANNRRVEFIKIN
jgi:OmpA-OmpF porin, OOP family